jgi:hypothetical protein
VLEPQLHEVSLSRSVWKSLSRHQVRWWRKRHLRHV